MGSNLMSQQMLLSAVNVSSGPHYLSLVPPKRAEMPILTGNSLLRVPPNASSHFRCKACLAESRKLGPSHETNLSSNPKLKSQKTRPQKTRAPKEEVDNSEKPFPPMIPKRPRRGRKSEAAAVEDYVRGSLERTFESIREQNPEILKDMEKIMKDKADPTDCFDGFDDESSDDDNDSDEDEVNDSGEKKMMVEEEDPDWPLDADIGWGIRASEYFDRHPIKNVVSEDGTEIDWEGETDDGLVKEINCLEWESFAFHPSPLIVLVFERYNRSSENWKVLRELEKAAEVYWRAKDRLPPRTVKIDINIERDLAYALKAKECPQILFLRGNKILYREKEFRSADELVLMIAHFYYNAKKPSFINDADLVTTKREVKHTNP